MILILLFKNKCRERASQVNCDSWCAMLKILTMINAVKHCWPHIQNPVPPEAGSGLVLPHTKTYFTTKPGNDYVYDFFTLLYIFQLLLSDDFNTIFVSAFSSVR